MEGFQNFNVFYWALGVFAIGLTVKNFMSLKGYKREREFANTYSKVLRQDEDCYEAISNYVNVEKVDSLKNKGKVILAYEKMVKGEDPTELVNTIDFKPMFYEKGRFNAKLTNRNSDIFVWLALVFAKARSLSMFDVIDKLSEKVLTYDEVLGKHLEYKLFKGLVSAIAERNDEDSAFLTKLLDGDYAGMIYEQRLIGLYKRIAASYLVYMGDTVDESFNDDLRDFATTLVGKCLMTDLEIIDKYPPLEIKEEEKTEEETSEETKEENTTEE